MVKGFKKLLNLLPHSYIMKKRMEYTTKSYNKLRKEANMTQEEAIHHIVDTLRDVNNPTITINYQLICNYIRWNETADKDPLT